MENVSPGQTMLPQHARPLAVQARLLALLEGLGVEHAPVWLNKPVKDFYELGESFRPGSATEDVQPESN